MAKPKTKQQLDRATDLRLQKTYGITLKEYNKLCGMNGGNCWICNKPAGTRRLSVDHDHSYSKVKLLATRTGGEWTASGRYNGVAYYCSDKSKTVAKQEVRNQMKRASVRGVACVWCNRGLRYYHDEPIFLRAAAEYLEGFVRGRTLRRLEG